MQISDVTHDWLFPLSGVPRRVTRSVCVRSSFIHSFLPLTAVRGAVYENNSLILNSLLGKQTIFYSVFGCILFFINAQLAVLHLFLNYLCVSGSFLGGAAVQSGRGSLCACFQTRHVVTGDTGCERGSLGCCAQGAGQSG